MILRVSLNRAYAFVGYGGTFSSVHFGHSVEHVITNFGSMLSICSQLSTFNLGPRLESFLHA